MEVIRAAQNEFFGAEYSEMKKRRPVSAKSQLVKLNSIVNAHCLTCEIQFYCHQDIGLQD
jgi:hypothetical protein